MIIRCIHNSGEGIRSYESKKLKKEELGRFECTSYTKFGISVGSEYLVMGMLLGKGGLTYLIDDHGMPLSYPYPLFEVIDHNLPKNWQFKSYTSSHEKFPYIESIWGYHELVFNDDHYSDLNEGIESATRIYFRRKIELEQALS